MATHSRCSGSMEPAFFRGDILFLALPQEDFVVGDIVVFKISGRDIPIVHRVIEVHETWVIVCFIVCRFKTLFLVRMVIIEFSPRATTTESMTVGYTPRDRQELS